MLVHLCALPYLLLVVPSLALAGLRGEVRGDVTVSVGRHDASITSDLRYTVSADHDIDTLRFFLYGADDPQDPKVDELLAEREWPRGYAPGSVDVEVDHVGPCTERGDAPANSALRPAAVRAERRRLDLPLPAPLPAGETLCVDLRATVRVPPRFGTFGVSRGVLTLSGGLVPHLVDSTVDGPLLDALPAALDHHLRLTLPRSYEGVISGHVLANRRGGHPAPLPVGITRSEPDSNGTFDLHLLRRPFLTLVVAPRRTLQSLPVDGGPVLWSGEPLRPRQARWIRASVAQVRALLRGRGLPCDEPIVFAEAPMRRLLFEDGDGVVIVSDRALELAEPFWRYHDVHLARAVLTSQVGPLIDATEPARDAPLLRQALPWWLVEDYVKRRWARHQGLRTILQRFSFLPAVDDLLETPAFPFADQIYDDPWSVDPLRADIRRWNRPLRAGRALFLRLEDQVGAESLRSAVSRFRPGSEGPPFFDRLASESGLPVRALVNAFQDDPPAENLRLLPVRRRGDHTIIEVERTGGADDRTEAPVELRISHRRGRKAGEMWLRWDGEGRRKRWDLHAPWPVGAVDLDPRGRVLELGADGLPTKADNRDPARLRATGYAYFLALSGNLGTFDAYGALSLRRAGDQKDHALFRVFANERVRVGGGGTWQHYFGRPRAGRRYEHRISTSFDVSWLEPRYAPTVAPLLLEGRLSWTWDGRAFSFFPSRSGRAHVSVFGGRDLRVDHADERTLAESAFVGFDTEGVRLLPLGPGNVLGLRFRFGAVAGNVAHRRFDLGGLDGVRGVPQGHVRGAALLAGSAEWRHAFVQDLDVRVPFGRLREIQGALFVEGGTLWGRGEGLPPSAAVGLGYGVRVRVDLLGFLPGVAGVDFAWSPRQPDGAWPIPAPVERWPAVPFQVYFVGSQSF